MKSTDPKYILARLLVRSYRFIKHLNSEFLKSKGYENIKIGHVMVMMNLKEEPVSVSEVVKCIEMSKQAVSVLIKELVAKDFINTSKHPSDSRAILVSKTEEGIKFLEVLNQSRLNLDQEVSTILGEERLDNLKHLLVDLVDNLEQRWGKLNDTIGSTKL
ncbi:MarR family winged helix-turn-helix transcriptional regulator [Aquirufa sp. ROCK-SH2]